MNDVFEDQFAVGVFQPCGDCHLRLELVIQTKKPALPKGDKLVGDNLSIEFLALLGILQ